MTSTVKICEICQYILKSKVNVKKSACENLLFGFLVDLSEKLDDDSSIDEHFSRSIFDNVHNINRTSCNGLTLMHVNILGGRNLSSDDSLEQDNNYVTAYDEDTAVEICRILINRGGSVSGNPVHEMRPLHIAIRREWMILSRILLEHGANPNIPESDVYASRPIDVAVINNNIEAIQLLHEYGASLDGTKTLFHRRPLSEAFVRGYLNVFRTLLQLGASTYLDLDRNSLRSLGTEIFLGGSKGRRHFIDLLAEHGANIESEFHLHPIRYEPDGINRLEPEIIFSWDSACIADLDPTDFVKWICQVRSLKALCRLRIRLFCFGMFNNGYQRLISLKFHPLMNQQLFNYIQFMNHVSRSR